VKVFHRCFQGLVAHRFLNGARIGSKTQGVGCVAVTQFMRQDHHAQFSPAHFNCALHIGFVKMKTDQLTGAGMAARMMGGKQPCPRPCELIFGIFFTEFFGDLKGDLVLLIRQPNRTCRI